MDRDKIAELYKKYNLVADDVFKHKNYLIITRSGIEKIQALEGINIKYEAIRSEPEFAVVKASTENLQTFGSARYGGKEWVKFDEVNQYGKSGKWKENGNTQSWYVMEIAEKRAMSRIVLKTCGFYELGVFGEDESEDFKRK